MELKEAIEKRYSVRGFTDEPVPVDILAELVRRAGLAPSINNAQPWKFLVLRDKEKIGELSNIVRDKVQRTFADRRQNIQKTVEYFTTIFEKAPALIFVASSSYAAISDVGDKDSHDVINEMRQFPDIQSVGAAVENMLLSAVDLGYGACWLSGLMIARDQIEQFLKVEPSLRLVTAVAVGKPQGTQAAKDKKPIEEIFQLLD